MVLEDQDLWRGFVGAGEREIEDVVVSEAVAEGLVGFGDRDVGRWAAVEDGMEGGRVVAQGVDGGV